MVFRIFIIGVIMSQAAFAFGQGWLKSSRSEVIRNVYRYKDKSYTAVCSDTTIHAQDTFTILKVEFSGPTKLNVYYFFNKYSGLCDSIEAYYYCSSCAEKGVKEILKAPTGHWKKFENNYYISRKHWTEKRDNETYFTSTAVYIQRTPDKPICTTIRVWLVSSPKDIWKMKMKKT